MFNDLAECVKSKGYFPNTLEFADYIIENRSNESDSIDNIRTFQNKLQLTTAIGFLSRYANIYAKTALSKSQISNIDEFIVLSYLSQKHADSILELSQNLVIEKTSTVELVKRLHRKKLVESVFNHTDKRKKIITISEVGKNELMSVLPLMNKAVEIVAANLKNNVVETLLSILKPLENVHKNIHQNSKLKDLNEILSSLHNNNDQHFFNQ